MKKIYFSLFLLLIFTGIINAQILITEVVDGTQALSYPRYVEITNEGSSSFNLQNYQLKIFMNGTATVFTYTFPSYVLPAGASLVVTNIDNTTADQRWSDYNLIAPAYCLYSQTNVIRGNGNDCYQLLNSSSAVVDVYGIYNVDGIGQPWEYTDSYAYRNLNITSPNSTFTLSEWTIAPVDILDGMGSNLSSYLTPGYRALNSENDILTFSFPEQTGPAVINPSLHRVDIEVTAIANLASLTPTITLSTSATVNPLSGEAHDFSVSPVVFTVTAQNSSQQAWNVYVTQASGASSETDILTFAFPGQLTPSDINTTAHTVSVIMPFGTNLSSLTPVITVSPGAEINPLSGISQNFTSAVSYTVTAENNITVQNWIVSVTTGNSSENDILSFTLAQQTSAAIINTTDHTIDIEVQNGTALTTLSPAITVSAGATINPASGTAQNFTAPFTYTVTAQDATQQDWEITVTVAAPLNNETDIISFSFPQQTAPAVINSSSHTVNIEVVNGTNVAALTPSIQISQGATIYPTSGVQIDFTSPVVFLVTAENGTNTQNWTVTVTEDIQLSSDAEITAFILSEQQGPAVINSAAGTVNIEVQTGTDVSDLSPNISISSGASISPVSGIPNDFTVPVIYTVTAQDMTTKQWTVTVSIYTNAENNIAPGYLTVSPNPASDFIIINAPESIINAAIYNISGNSVNSICLSGNTRINIESLKPGIYILCTELSSGLTVRTKFIKSR